MKIEELEKMPFFSIQEVKNCFFWISTMPAKRIIYELKKKGIVVQLKKWLYTSTSFLKYQKDLWYDFFIANNLYQPSYISGVTALDYYGIFSESSTGIFSITLNKPFKCINQVGIFDYKNIKSSLFNGYVFKIFWKYKIMFASPAKALFDYFWYYKKRVSVPTKNIFENLRLNVDRLTNKDLKEFETYCMVSNSKKMKIFYSLLCEICGFKN